MRKAVNGKKVRRLVNPKAAGDIRTITCVWSEAGLDNAQSVEELYFGIENFFSMWFRKEAGTVDPKYYDNENTLRLYYGNTASFAVADGYAIRKIEFTTGSYKFTKAPEMTTGTFDVDAQSWMGKSDYVVLQTYEKVFIKSIVIYIEELGEEQDPEPDPETTDWSAMGKGQYKDILVAYENITNPVFDLQTYHRLIEGYKYYQYENPYQRYAPDNYSVIERENIFNTPIFGQYTQDYYFLHPWDLGLTFYDEEFETQTRLIAMSMAVWEASYVNGDHLLPNDLSMYAKLEDNKFNFPSNSFIFVMVDASTGQILNARYFTNENTLFALPGGNLEEQEPEPEVELFVYGEGDGLTSSATPLRISKGADGNYTFSVNNLESFYISENPLNGSSDLSNCFSAQAFSSTLGKNLPVEYGRSCMTPWKGNYTVKVSGDLNTINLTTTTSKPTALDMKVYVRSNPYNMTKTGQNEYTFTTENGVTGPWYIATPEKRYRYAYVGAANAEDSYLFDYDKTNTTGLKLNKGDKVIVTIDDDIYTKPASVRIERYVEEPVVPEDPATKELTLNGIVYTLYPSEGYFMATNGANAKNNVVLLETVTADSGKELTFRGVADGAFKDNNAIRSVTFPEGTVSIGKDAFRNCENLEFVNFSSTIKTIDSYAFYNCSYLGKITLPNSITSLGTGIFSGCSDLYSFNFNNVALAEVPDAMFEDCIRLKEVKLPTTVTRIGANAFANSGVVSVGNTKGITVIGNRAFEASAINEFDFNGVTEIGIGAFKMTTIKEAHLPNTVASIGMSAFEDCNLLGKLTLPSNLSRIEASTFANCTALHSVILPATLTYISDGAFSNSGLISVEVGANVTEIGANCFSGEELMSVVLNGNIESLANTPVSTKGILKLASVQPPLLGKDRLGVEPKIVMVPTGSGKTYKESSRWKDYNIVEETGVGGTVYVQKPGQLAQDIPTQLKVMPAQVTNVAIKGEINDLDLRVIRSNMTSLITLDLRDAVISELPKDAFKGKSCLREVYLPASLTVIPESAFENCALLSNIDIPASVITIEDNAFKGCMSASGNLMIPAGCSTIGEMAFANCYRLDGADLSASALTDLSESCFANDANLDVVALPNTMKSIGKEAFVNTGISDITLPSALESIEESAFEGCFYLASISLPNTLSSIATRAFAKSGLGFITLPESLENIEDETFADCLSLMFVNLPTSLKYVGNRALASHAVSAVSTPVVTPPATGFAPFENVDNLTCAMSIPGMSYNAYLSSEYWGAFVSFNPNIDVTIQDNANVNYVDEEDYQDITNSDASAAPARVRAARAINSDSRHFARLFNGAQLFREENSRTRFFFNPEDNVEVFYNNRNVTAEIDPLTCSWVCPNFDSSSRLRIVNHNAAVNSIYADKYNNNDVYDLTGRMLIHNASEDQIRNLEPGVYVVGGKKRFIQK